MRGMKRLFLGLAAVFVLLIAAQTVRVQAATAKFVNLGYSEKSVRTYRKYDVTGDGAADTLKISLTRKDAMGSYGSLAVSVNGKAAFSKKYFEEEGTFGTTVQLAYLANGRVYVFLEDNMLNDYHSISALFQYKDGKLASVWDFTTMNGLFPKKTGGAIFERSSAEIKGVSGNAITFNEYFQCSAIAQVEAQFRLSYRGGRLQMASRYGKILRVGSKAASVKRKLLVKTTAYKTGNAAKVTRNFYKNDMLRITTLYVGNGIVRFRVVNNSGRSGYISCLKYRTTGAGREPLFEGLGYAG